MARKPISARGTQRSRREESATGHDQKSLHVPVMVAEVIETLVPKAGEVIVDATYGGGGHSRAIAHAAPRAKIISIDADPSAGADITGNFADIAHLLARADVGHVDKILFDLGWRSDQLASGRGFSFMHNEPLNMSYGPEPRSGLTAAQMLNTLSEQAVADILFGYGGERYAKRIAANIVRRRDIAPIVSTFELTEVVRDAVPAAYRHGRTNPVTKTFQALRMAVNDELGAITKGLTAAWSVLAPGGRMVVITFHSTEDRLVKQLFKQFGGELLYKKPLVPSATEVKRNPAARSAKLRAIAKH